MSEHIDDEESYRTPPPGRLRGEAKFLTRGRAHADAAAAAVLLLGWFLIANEVAGPDSPGAQVVLLVAGLAVLVRAGVQYVMTIW